MLLLATRLFVLALLCSSLAAAAQGGGVLQGTVTGDGAPLLRARVLVQDDATGDTLAVALTDAAGRYSVLLGTAGERPPETTTSAYWVGAVHPNPARPGAQHVTLPYAVPGDVPLGARFELFDVLGRRAAAEGPLAAGVYFYRLRFDDDAVSPPRRLTVPDVTRLSVDLRQVFGMHGAHGAEAPRAHARVGSARRVTAERYGFVTQTATVTGPTADFALVPAPAPTAAFSAPATATAGQTVVFDGGASQGDGLVYAWAFGDGGRAGGARAAHVFAEAGTYTVALTVATGFGATATATRQIAVQARPAAADSVTVRGRVVGTSGAPVSGATVAVVGESAPAGATGADGRVTLARRIPAGRPVALRVARPGFAEQRVVVDAPAAGGEVFFEATLIGRRPAVTLARAEEGGAVRGVDGARVELPVEGLVRADGSLATGDVQVRITPVNVADDAQLGAFPGPFAGVTPDGDAPLILSLGTAEYTFEQGGQPLQLAPGRHATVEIPLYVTQNQDGSPLAAGQTQPLWSFDETAGTWRLEGTGTVVAAPGSPTGFALRATVTHFSWWNCDVAPDPARFTPEIDWEDENGNPTGPPGPNLNVFVRGTALTAGPRAQATSHFAAAAPPELFLPPGVPVRIEGFAVGGAFAAEASVPPRPAGQGGPVRLVFRPIPVSPGGSVAPDTTITANLPAPDAVNEFTVLGRAGQDLDLYAERGVGSTLNGRVEVFRPDGTRIGTAYDFPASQPTTRRLDTDGVHTVRVTARGATAGVYRLILTTPAEAEIALGKDRTDPLGRPGKRARYRFAGVAGEHVQAFAVRATGVLGGNVRLVAPSGAVVAQAPWATSAGHFAARLPETGTYVLDVGNNASAGGDVRVGLDAVAEVSLNTAVVAAAPAGVSGLARYWRFEGTAGTIARAGRAQIARASGQGIPAADLGALNMVRLQTETYYLVVRPNAGQTLAAGVARVEPPAALALVAGRTEVSGRLAVPGALGLYAVPAPAGAGLLVDIAGAGPSPLAQTFGTLMRVGTGTFWRPETQQVAPAAQQTGGAGAPLVHSGWALPTGDYVLAVHPNEVTAPGDFALRADLVASAPAIEVDDDLAQCPGAATRSAHAAALAAPADGTVRLCAGSYAERIPAVVVAAGVTVEGTDRAATVLAESPAFVSIEGRGANLTLRSLTVEPGGAAAVGLSAPGARIENATIRRRPGEPAGRIGVNVQTNASGLVVQSTRFERLTTALQNTSGTGNAGGQVRGSVFEGGGGLVQVTGAGWRIDGNTFATERAGVSYILDGQGVTDFELTGNTVTVTGVTGIAGNSPVFRVGLAQGVAGATALVRGNTVTTPTAALSLTGSNQPGGQITAEQNVFTITEPQGRQAVDYAAVGQTRLTLHNNVFDGVISAGALDLRNLHLAGETRVFNNTLRVAQSSFSQPTNALVRLTAQAGTGAVPVTLANNLLAGRGPTTGISVQTGLALASNYNLLFGFATPYVGPVTAGPNDVLGQDPLFAGPQLRVAPTSPAVNAGASAAVIPGIPPVDVTGAPRPQGAGVDIGAHEQP